MRKALVSGKDLPQAMWSALASGKELRRAMRDALVSGKDLPRATRDALASGKGASQAMQRVLAALRLAYQVRTGWPDAAEVARVQGHELIHLGNLGGAGYEGVVNDPAKRDRARGGASHQRRRLQAFPRPPLDKSSRMIGLAGSVNTPAGQLLTSFRASGCPSWRRRDSCGRWPQRSAQVSYPGC